MLTDARLPLQNSSAPPVLWRTWTGQCLLCKLRGQVVLFSIISFLILTICDIPSITRSIVRWVIMNLWTSLAVSVNVLSCHDETLIEDAFIEGLHLLVVFWYLHAPHENNASHWRHTGSCISQAEFSTSTVGQVPIRHNTHRVGGSSRFNVGWVNFSPCSLYL